LIQEKEEILKKCNASCHNTLMETLSIEFVDMGADWLKAKMPVTSKVHQPMGILHGGATMALAESVGSVATRVFCSDGHLKNIFGLEIAGNHIKYIKEGFVFATAKHIHLGRTTQVWEIKIKNEKEELISNCKLTTITLPKK